MDVFGILRGKYLSPAFAIKVGETAIRNCFRDQLSAIRKEGMDYMGEHPCVFTEIGIPYDMDDKYAYKTGDFSSQSSAMDANHFALEGCGANGYSLWVYMATVSVSSLIPCIPAKNSRTTTSGAISGTARIFQSSLSTISLCPFIQAPMQKYQVRNPATRQLYL